MQITLDRHLGHVLRSARWTLLSAEKCRLSALGEPICVGPKPRSICAQLVRRTWPEAAEKLVTGEEQKPGNVEKTRENASENSLKWIQMDPNGLMETLSGVFSCSSESVLEARTSRPPRSSLVARRVPDPWPGTSFGFGRRFRCVPWPLPGVSPMARSWQGSLGEEASHGS